MLIRSLLKTTFAMRAKLWNHVARDVTYRVANDPSLAVRHWCGSSAPAFSTPAKTGSFTNEDRIVFFVARDREEIGGVVGSEGLSAARLTVREACAATMTRSKNVGKKGG